MFRPLLRNRFALPKFALHGAVIAGMCCLLVIGSVQSQPAIPSASLSLLPASRTATGIPFGVYQGNGCDGAKRLSGYSQWLNKEPDFALDFFDAESWQSMLNDANWTVKCWAKHQRKVVFSIPMLPSRGASLAEGAMGNYDQYFTQMAQLLVANGFGNTIIRLGWEFNGGWYPWSAKKDPDNWVKYWQRIVTTMRAVPGAAFKFDWCSAQGYLQIPADKMYPGDEYVDIIGRDLYNQTWDRSATTPEARWQSLLTESYGLNWLRQFAAKHNKPISLPEWATGTRPDGRGGGDDAYFITRVAEWIRQNNVAYHSYWDYPAKDYNGRLSDGSKPQAAAALREAIHARHQ